MEAFAENKKNNELQISENKQRRILFMKRLMNNHSIVVGGSIIILLTLVAIIAPLITSYTPFQMETASRLMGPSTQHLLGTDNLGRDLFSRIVYGARASMGVGIAVAVVTTILGIIIGLYAAYFSVLDHILMRICDGLMAFPAILLAIAIMAVLGPRVENVVLALSVVFTPYVARVVRSSAIVVREQTYIEAMRAQGASSWRIIWMHIAPNTFSSLIVQATFIFAEAIIIEASLSFLGVGVPAPSPSWGNILYDGKLVIFNAWWMVLFPGICIVLSVLGLNLFGDGLRDLMDPHTRKKS